MAWLRQVGLTKAFARVVRDPLFSFLLVGAAIFAGYAVIEQQRNPAVRYTPEAEKALVDEFEMLSGRKADAADRARIEKNFITGELLFREAIDRNMHLTDGETRARLTDKVRYLIAGAPVEPTEEQLVDHYSNNIALYRSEPKTTFSQIFRSTKPGDSAAILAALNSGQTVPGDDFWLGSAYPAYGDSMVRGIFGQPFVTRLKEAQEGVWFGPVQSPRGWHFVRKTGSIAPALMPYSAVRDQVRQDYMMARTNAAIDGAIGKLKEKFDVEVVR